MTKEEIMKMVAEYKSIVEQYPNLKEIFTPEYYSSLETQMELYTKDHGSRINPIFLWYLQERDVLEERLKFLDKHIGLVFAASSSAKDKKHIAGQLRSFDAYDTVFELAVLSALLEKFSPSDIELFPTTTKTHDVEAKVKLIDRWVYIEVSVLKDTQEDANEVTELLRLGGGVGKGKFIDIDRDKLRYLGKSEYKAQQFLPNTPNVLFLALIALRPAIFNISELDNETIEIENIGAVMEFDIHLKYKTFKEGIASCRITEEEKDKLIGIFNS